MKKETKRKAFNFLRSYFDVLNKLQTDDDKLKFLLAIIDKQFLGVDPPEFKNPIVDLAWESQRHQIESSVKGYQDKTGNVLKGGSIGGHKGGSLQEKEKEKEKEKQKVLPFQQIVDHLNLVCGTNYKSTTSGTQSKITARFNEGFKLNDFIRVIEFKFHEWGNDQKFKSFLRPETLFGTKFESYLENAGSFKGKPIKIKTNDPEPINRHLFGIPKNDVGGNKDWEQWKKRQS